MIIPIRCFTCGKVIADKYDYYVTETMKLSKTEETEPKKTVDPAKPQTPHFDKIRTGSILDKLGLTRYCCRRHMIANVDMMDII